VTALLVAHLVEDPPHVLRGPRGGIRLDYIGIGLLVLGIGALQVMLDRGQEDDWFGSSFITTLAIVAGVCLACLVVWEWFHERPIIDVRLFKNFNFLGANRDRGRPRGLPLPHHRAYGSRTRRFDGVHSYLAAKAGSPRVAKYRAGNASVSAGVWHRRHGPCADLLVFHASRTLTPRRRNSR
jgi:hypothetical protein